MNALRFLLWSTTILAIGVASPGLAEDLGFETMSWSPAGSAEARSLWVCIHGSGDPLVDGCRCAIDTNSWHCDDQ